MRMDVKGVSIMTFLFIFIFSVVIFSPLNVYAYLGPGLGLGIVGTVLGVLFSVILGLVGIFWYPLKRFLGKGQKGA